MKTLILCGGEGTRLRSVLNGAPKPMIGMQGRPFLEWLLLALRVQGIREVTLCTGYRGEEIERHFGAGERLDMKIEYSHEPTKLGTAGAIKLAVADTDADRALVLNGDSYVRLNIGRMMKEHTTRRALASLWLVPVDDSSRYGSVAISRDGAITAFEEKITTPRPGLISAGGYLIEREVIDNIPGGQTVSIETDIFPRMVSRSLFGVVSDGPFVDIGTPESYRGAINVLRPEFERLEHKLPAIERAIHVRERLLVSTSVQARTAELSADAIVRAADIIVATFRGGGKVLLCGNGGSAADCQHVAAEFTNLLDRDLDRAPLPAIALTTDTSFLTAFANDRGFDGIFERQVRALARAGDVLIAISTSGRSENVRRAVAAAKELGVHTIGLLGERGPLVSEVNCAVVVPSRNTQHVQESLLPVEHAICELVEQTLFRGEVDQPC